MDTPGNPDKKVISQDEFLSSQQQLLAELQTLRNRVQELESQVAVLQPEDGVPPSRLLQIIDSIPAYISYIDSNHIYRFVNKRYEEWFECSRHEIVGKHIREVQGEQVYRRIRGYLKWAAMGVPISFEHSRTANDGSLREHFTTYVPHCDVQGKVIGFFAQIFDISDRKYMENALRDSERNYRLLMEGAFDAIFLADIQGNFILTNSRASEMLGYSRDELLKMNVRQLIAPESLAATPLKMQELIQTGYITSERPMLRKDGVQIFVETRVRLLNDNLQLAVVRDMTQRKQAEENLRRIEEKSQSLLAAIPDLMFEISNEGKIIDYQFYSDEEERTLVVASIGKHLSEVLPPEIAEEALSAMKTASETGQVQTLHFQLSTINDRSEYFETRFSPTAQGEFLILVRNVTDQKRAELVLKENEARLQALVSSVEDIVFEADSEGTLLNLWTTNQEWLPRPKTELLGLPITELFDLEMGHYILKLVRQVLDTGNVTTLDHPLRLQDGQHFFWSRISPIPATEGIRKTACLVLRDITGIQNIEETLRRSDSWYREFVEEHSLMVCRFLPDGTLTYVNHAYCCYFGKTPQELLGNSFMPLIPKEDQKIVDSMMEDLYPEMSPIVHEHRIILADGRIRWNRWTKRVIQDTDGRFLEYQGVGEDITEQINRQS